MSVVYFGYSAFVGGDHFVFGSKRMKNNGWLSFSSVPVDLPALEPNNLTVANSDNYPSVTSLLRGFVSPRGAPVARDVLTTAKVLCRASDTSRIRSRGMAYWINACLDFATYYVSVCVRVGIYVIFTYLLNAEILSDAFTRIDTVSVSLNVTCLLMQRVLVTMCVGHFVLSVTERD